MKKKKFIEETAEILVILTVCVLLMGKNIFSAICVLPMCVVTRPVVRWAFCVQRSIERLCKKLLNTYGYFMSEFAK